MARVTASRSSSLMKARTQRGCRPFRVVSMIALPRPRTVPPRTVPWMGEPASLSRAAFRPPLGELSHTGPRAEARGPGYNAPSPRAARDGSAQMTMTTEGTALDTPAVSRIVAHVDMDAFYAAVEERRNPDLRGRPIVVGADPKAGAGRGVVTTASYAARKYGIRSAMPISRAWRLAEAARRRGEPEAVFLRGDHAAYREVSGRIMAIAADGSDAFEEASIDEAYLDVSSLADFARAEAHARALKADIAAREGLTASVGIGPNKLVAKIASDFRKPDGLTIVEPAGVQGFLDPLPVRRLPGIGPKSEAILRARGIL